MSLADRDGLAAGHDVLRIDVVSVGDVVALSGSVPIGGPSSMAVGVQFALAYLMYPASRQACLIGNLCVGPSLTPQILDDLTTKSC